MRNAMHGMRLQLQAEQLAAHRPHVHDTCMQKAVCVFNTD